MIAFSDDILREASEWFARLHNGEATAQDHVRLGDWLAAQPENQAAYEFVTETGRLATHVHSTSDGRRRPAPARRSRLHGIQNGAPAARRQWARAAGVAAAAAIVAGIGIAIVTQPHVESYRTAVGEIRNVTLTDGSTLVLNGATSLTVRFTGDARELDMETGEFFVTVGKDPARPFRVHARGRVIEDIGTAFDVDTNGNQVDVAVGEGTVMISRTPGGAAADPAIVLNQGEALSYSADQIIGAPRMLAAPDVATWRVGILSYDRSQLEWLVADLNRRFDRPIAVPDPKLATLPITLTLKLHDRDTTIGTLEKLLPVRAVSKADGSTELVSLNP